MLKGGKKCLMLARKLLNDVYPASGKEMQEDHFALAVSAKVFNKVMGLVLACLISQGKSEASRGMLSSLLEAGTYSLPPA